MMEVRRNKAVVMKGRRNGSLYYLCGSAVKLCDQVNMIKLETAEACHMRLGYPAIGSINELMKREVITGSMEMPGQSCEESIMGKAKKLPFQKSYEVHSVAIVKLVEPAAESLYMRSGDSKNNKKKGQRRLEAATIARSPTISRNLVLHGKGSKNKKGMMREMLRMCFRRWNFQRLREGNSLYYLLAKTVRIYLLGVSG